MHDAYSLSLQFRRKEHLKKHLEMHAERDGEWDIEVDGTAPAAPVPCLVCGKQYAGEARLKQHMMIHTGERPYECPICQKRVSKTLP